MKISFCIISFFLIIISADFVFADEDTVLDQVVVTYTKVPTATDKTSAPVKVITREQIEESEAADVVDLLKKVAGFSVVRSGSRGADTSLFVRGGESDHNLVLINGVQVNQPGGGFSFGRLTTENIERIEILKGSHSALYGSDALASVINIITKTGSGAPKLNLSTALGVREEDSGLIQEYDLSFSGGTDQYGYFLSYGRIDDEGILDVNNEYKNNTFTGVFNVNPTEQLTIDLTGIYQDSRFELATEFAGDQFDILDPDQYQDNQTLVLGSNISYFAADWWENVISLGFSREERDFEDEPNLDINPFDGFSSRVEEKRFTFEYRSNFFYDFENVSTTTTVGFEYENENVDDGTTDESRNNYAFYLQELLTIFDNLFVTAGIRLDDNEEFGAEFSPRLSVAYLFSDYGSRLRAAIGRGIKEPTFFENFGGFGLIGNLDLDPEESLSIEGGIDQKLFSDMVEVNLTVFWNRYKNLIVFDFGGFSNGTNFENINEVETKGVEVGGTFSPGYGVTVGANYTFLDTEVTDDGGLGTPDGQFFEGAELIRRPEHSFNFIVNYLYRNFNANFAGRYVGTRDDINFSDSSRIENDSFFVADLAASYLIPYSSDYLNNIKVFTRANNIFSEDYEEVFGFSSPGFSIVGGISVEIGG